MKTRIELELELINEMERLVAALAKLQALLLIQKVHARK
jgi:hypothetical protein